MYLRYSFLSSNNIDRESPGWEIPKAQTRVHFSKWRTRISIRPVIWQDDAAELLHEYYPKQLDFRAISPISKGFSLACLLSQRFINQPCSFTVTWPLLWNEAHVSESHVIKSGYSNYTLDVEIWVGTPHGHHMENVWTHTLTSTHTHTHPHTQHYTSVMWFCSPKQPYEKSKYYHPNLQVKTKRALSSILNLWEEKWFAQGDSDSGALGSESTTTRNGLCSQILFNAWYSPHSSTPLKGSPLVPYQNISGNYGPKVEYEPLAMRFSKKPKFQHFMSPDFLNFRREMVTKFDITQFKGVVRNHLFSL